MMSGGVLAAARRRSAGSSFNPATIANLVLWLEADSLALADGASVSSWVDQASAWDFTQATSAARPTYRASAVNGKPAVEFDGVDDYLRSPQNLNYMDGSVVVVARKTAEAEGAVLFTADEGVLQRFWGLSQNAAEQWNGIQRNGDTADNHSGNTVVTLGNWSIAEWESTGTAYSLRVNGVAQTLTFSTGSNTGDWLGDTTLLDSLTVGARVRSSLDMFLQGQIAAIFMTSAKMSSTDLTNLRNHLSSKYGISV